MTDLLGNGGNSDLELQAEASFGWRRERQADGLVAVSQSKKSDKKILILQDGDYYS